MTQAECTAILAALAETLRTELDVPTFRAYFRALKDLPAVLFHAAADRATTTPRREYDPVFPTPPMLRQYAEAARLEIQRAHPFACLCGNCSQDGFVPREIGGVMRMVKGSCWRAHQERLARLGVGTSALQLTTGTGQEE